MGNLKSDTGLCLVILSSYIIPACLWIWRSGARFEETGNGLEHLAMLTVGPWKTLHSRAQLLTKYHNQRQMNHWYLQLIERDSHNVHKRNGYTFKIGTPASILYKSVAGRYRPVSYHDGPITALYRFIKNDYWDLCQDRFVSPLKRKCLWNKHKKHAVSCCILFVSFLLLFFFLFCFLIRLTSTYSVLLLINNH